MMGEGGRGGRLVGCRWQLRECSRSNVVQLGLPEVPTSYSVSAGRTNAVGNHQNVLNSHLGVFLDPSQDTSKMDQDALHFVFLRDNRIKDRSDLERVFLERTEQCHRKSGKSAIIGSRLGWFQQ